MSKTEDEKKVTVEVERTLNGITAKLRRSVSSQHTQETISELSRLLMQYTASSVESAASLVAVPTRESTTQGDLPIITPSVETTGKTQPPILANAPHSYRRRDAIVEILNPAKSTWAGQPRTVKEIQNRLMELGVRGVSNIQNFDSIIRGLAGQGTLRREKMDGKYVYFMPA